MAGWSTRKEGRIAAHSLPVSFGRRAAARPRPPSSARRGAASRGRRRGPWRRQRRHCRDASSGRSGGERWRRRGSWNDHVLISSLSWRGEGGDVVGLHAHVTCHVWRETERRITRKPSPSRRGEELFILFYSLSTCVVYLIGADRFVHSPLRWSRSAALLPLSLLCNAMQCNACPFTSLQIGKKICPDANALQITNFDLFSWVSRRWMWGAVKEWLCIGMHWICNPSFLLFKLIQSVLNIFYNT